MCRVEKRTEERSLPMVEMTRGGVRDGRQNNSSLNPKTRLDAGSATAETTNSLHSLFAQIRVNSRATLPLHQSGFCYGSTSPRHGTPDLDPASLSFSGNSGYYALRLEGKSATHLQQGTIHERRIFRINAMAINMPAIASAALGNMSG